MDSLLTFLSPLLTLVAKACVIILIFVYVIKPLFNYFAVNREIEHRKKLIKECEEARRQAAAARGESRASGEAAESTPASDTPTSPP